MSRKGKIPVFYQKFRDFWTKNSKGAKGPETKRHLRAPDRGFPSERGSRVFCWIFMFISLYIIFILKFNNYIYIYIYISN